MTHTHSELTDPHLRAVLANELLILRSAMRRIGVSVLQDDFAYGVRTGLDTFARRLQDINKRGLEAAYKQNFTSP
jgi:uncharacterized protein (DUF934 family)